MMNKQWISVIIAACFEVGWVIGLKHATSVLEWIGTAIAIFISFICSLKQVSIYQLGPFMQSLSD